MMGKKKTAMKRGGMAKKKTAKMRGGGMASGSREGSVINTPTAFKKGGRVKKTGPSRPLAVAKKTIEKLKKQIENMKPSSRFKARRDFLGGSSIGFPGAAKDFAKRAAGAAAGLLSPQPRKSRPDMSDIAGRKERPQSNPSEYNRSPGRTKPLQRPGSPGRRPKRTKPLQRPGQQGQPGRIRPPQKPGREPRRMPGMVPGLRRGLPSGTVIGKDGRPVPSLRASKGGRVK